MWSPKRLHYKHCHESGCQSHNAVYDLGPDETFPALGKKRNRGMAVLGYAAGKEHRERDYSCGEQRDEYHMWTGLGDNAY